MDPTKKQEIKKTLNRASSASQEREKAERHAKEAARAVLNKQTTTAGKAITPIGPTAQPKGKIPIHSPTQNRIT